MMPVYALRSAVRIVWSHVVARAHTLKVWNWINVDNIRFDLFVAELHRWAFVVWVDPSTILSNTYKVFRLVCANYTNQVYLEWCIIYQIHHLWEYHSSSVEWIRLERRCLTIMTSLNYTVCYKCFNVMWHYSIQMVILCRHYWIATFN